MKPTPTRRARRAAVIVVSLACACLAPEAWATDYTWDGGDADDDLWGSGDNWVGNVAPSPGSGNSLIFAGTTRLTPSNNYGNGDDFQNITFDSTAGSFTLGRDGTQGIDWFGSITNNSANAQTIGFNFYQRASNAINAASGDITLNSSALVTRDGQGLTLNAASGKTIKLSGVITDGSSAGSTVAVTGAGTVNFDAANTFSSGIGIDSGTVLATTSNSALGTGTVWIGNGGSTYGNTSAKLTIGTSGLTLTNAITTNKADYGGSQGTGTRTIASSYTSGTSTLSTGAISINGGLVFDTATGGTLAVSSTIQNGSDSGVVLRTLTKTGGGTLTLSGANTYSGGTTIDAGTLTISGASGTPGTGAVAIGNGAVFEWNAQGGDRTVSAVNSFSGAGTFLKSGSNNLILQGTNTSTFSGTVRVTGGLLILDTAAGFENGAPALDLAGGSIVLGNAFDGGIATFGDLSGNGDIRADYGNANVTRTVSINQTDTTTYSGVIGFIGSSTRTVALTKSGEGTLTLTGANTYTGATNVTGGKLVVSNTMRGTSGMTVSSGATLELGATNMFTSGHSAAMDNSRVLTADGGTLLMNGSMDSRIGNVTLTNGATWTSNRVLTNYDVLLANTSTGAATVTVSGTGASVMNGTGGIHLQGVQNFAVSDVTGDADADLTVSMILASQGSAGGDAGGINKTGAGTMLLSAANTFTGNVAVNAGILQFGKAGPGNGSGGGPLGPTNTNVTKCVVASGATLDINGYADTNYGVTIAGTGTANQGALINNGASTSYGNIQTPNIKLSANASIGGTGNFYMIASGYGANTLDLNNCTLTKTGTNTFYLCNTTVNAGTIQISGGTLSVYNPGGKPSTASAAAITLDDTSGAKLDLNSSALSVGSLAGGGATGGNVTMSGALTVGALNTDTTYGGVISGGGALTKTGTGTLTLTNANTYTGNTTVSGGTLAIGTGGSLYATGSYFSGAGVTVSGGGVLETRNWDYGNGYALNQLRNNYFAVVLDNGTVRFTENTSSLRAFQINSGGATLEVAEGVTYEKLAGTTGGQDIIYGNSAGPLTLTGAGDGIIRDGLGSYGSTTPWTSGLTKSGTGTWTLYGANTYTGATNVDDGTLVLGNASALGTNAAGTTIASGATLNINGQTIAEGETITAAGTGVAGYAITGSGTIQGDLVLTDDTTIGGASGDLQIGTSTTPRTITGAYTLTKDGANRVWYRGPADGTGNTLSAVVIADGTFGIEASNNALNGVPVTVNADGILSSWGTGSAPTSQNNPITLNGGTLGSDLTGQSYTGTVTLTADSTLGASSSAQSFTITGAIGETGGSYGLTKTQGGTVTLTGTNTYSGDTTVSAGTLVVDGNQSAANGNVTVASGATLAGTGTVGGATTVNGTLAPTPGSSGDPLAFSSTLAFDSGSSDIFSWTLNADKTDPGKDASNEGDYGQVSVTGAASGTTVFSVMLGTNAFTDAFWDTDKSWTNVFSASGLTDLTTVFTSFGGTGVASDGTVAGQGYFTFNGSTLNWTMVPELSNLLIGALLGAGMMRRKRVC